MGFFVFFCVCVDTAATRGQYLALRKACVNVNLNINVTRSSSRASEPNGLSTVYVKPLQTVVYVLNPRSDCIDHTVVCLITHDCSHKL